MGKKVRERKDREGEGRGGRTGREKEGTGREGEGRVRPPIKIPGFDTGSDGVL